MIARVIGLGFELAIIAGVGICGFLIGVFVLAVACRLACQAFIVASERGWI